MTQITNLRSEQSEETEGSIGRWFIAEFTLPTSYANPGGTPGVSAALGLQKGSIVAMIPANHLGYFWEYHPETDAIRVYQQPGVAAAGSAPEVPNATNLSGVGTVRALVAVKSGGF